MYVFSTGKDDGKCGRSRLGMTACRIIFGWSKRDFIISSACYCVASGAISSQIFTTFPFLLCNCRSKSSIEVLEWTYCVSRLFYKI